MRYKRDETFLPDGLVDELRFSLCGLLGEVELSEEREENLDASYRVQRAVDRVGHHRLHILKHTQ